MVLHTELVDLAKETLGFFRAEFLSLSLKHRARNFSVNRIVNQCGEKKSRGLGKYFMRCSSVP